MSNPLTVGYCFPDRSWAGHIPGCAETTTCTAQRLPGILAATGMLLLLVMSVVALWPPTNGSPLVPRVQAAQASFPKRLFDKCCSLSLQRNWCKCA